MIRRIYYWFRAFKMVESAEKAKEMGLHWRRNVHGDEINHINCRSLWNDDYWNVYRCRTLKECKYIN